MPALKRKPACQTAQLWDGTCNIGDGQHPSTGEMARPGLKVFQQSSGAGAVFSPAAAGTLVDRGQSPKCPLSTSSQALPEG